MVAWGLAASGYEGGDTLAKGIQYIQGAMDLTADTYTMAMCANALLAIDPQDTDLDAVLAELMERAVTEGNLTYWESDYPGITSASEVVSSSFSPKNSLISQLLGTATGFITGMMAFCRTKADTPARDSEFRSP